MSLAVAAKAVQANSIKNGVAMLNVNKFGTRVKDETYVESNQTIAEMNSNYNTRFDDPTYYS